MTTALRNEKSPVIPPRAFIYVLAGSFVVALMVAAIGPVDVALKSARHNVWMQQGRQIGQILFSYAADNTANGNAFPDGKSSTEVFQKLIDAGDVTDPAIFYFPMPGKVAPVPGQKLKPENVCWDVTAGVLTDSSDYLPIVFMTGYKVTYVAGASARPRQPPPRVGQLEPLTWWQRLWRLPATMRYEKASGVAVFYKGNNAVYFAAGITDPDGSVGNFISPDFKPDGHVYRQLTPDGVLP